MSYRSIRPGEVFEFWLESATEQNDNVAKKRKKKTKKQKRRRKGLSRWRWRQQRIKSTDIFGFKLFFYFLSTDCLFPAETHRYSTDTIWFGSSLSYISASRGKKKTCGKMRPNAVPKDQVFDIMFVQWIWKKFHSWNHDSSTCHKGVLIWWKELMNLELWWATLDSSAVGTLTR